MTEKLFKKGEVIFKEGTPGESMYDITDGTVGIFVNYGSDGEQKLTELKKGQFFGEMAVIESYSRSATAVALDDAKVFEISSGEMNEYFEKQPDRIIEIMKHLGTRIRELTADYTEVSKTIKGISDDGDSNHDDTLVELMRKFAATYKRRKSMSLIQSVATLNKISETSHSEGFTKGIKSYSKGAVIFKDGEDGSCMYDIHAGRIGIFKDYGTSKEKRLADLGTNKFFGELGMIDNVKRSATAVVMEDGTTLEAISIDDLKELFTKNPLKAEMILAHMSYRLRSLTNSYMEACKLVSDVSDAEAAGSVDADLMKQAADYQPKLYD